VQPSWMTAQAVRAQTLKGFTIAFAEPAPAKATLNWLLVR